MPSAYTAPVGVGLAGVQVACDLHSRGVWQSCTSVLDMGDQELHLPYDTVAACLRDIGVEPKDEGIDRAAGSLPTALLWRSLGFTTCRRSDLRGGPDVLTVDLNEPLSPHTPLWQASDLVTDFGNNEHAFNVGEAYRTMHRLTRPGGYLWIVQAWIGGNGLYAFTPDFYEALAAANRYAFITSHLILDGPEGSHVLPYDLGILSRLRRDGSEGVHHCHVLQRTSEADFTWPGEGTYSSGGFPYRIVRVSPPVPSGRMTLPITSGDFTSSVGLLTIGGLVNQITVAFREIARRLLSPGWWRAQRPLRRRR